ncbi:MAG TPA: radical SAM/SPASM domain-containing protein [Candidatus Sulfotelmatobacter sp.]|jgi:MoaA/NifB/PqqE/SkfB family radical SAM enzyme|nr:radical SAM/SPASM domain-containing protein [Candidatus Sulfotelmatobacter sp.]
MSTQTAQEPVRYSALRDGAKRINLADASPLPCPMTIYIETTNICNFKCKYCPESFDNYEQISGGYSRMSLEEFERVCDQIAEIGQLKTLNFYMMGEPFVNKQLPEFIKVARRKNISEKIIVTSNGSLIDENLAEQILETDLDYLRFSIYGIDQDIFSRTTNSKIKLDRIVGRIEHLKSLRDQRGLKKPFLYAKMIDTQDPAQNNKFLEMFNRICDEAVIEPVMNWNDPDEGNLSGHDTESLLTTSYFANKKEACPFPFYTLVIHSDLTVSVCCVDWAKKTAVGSLKTESLREVWLGPKLRDFRLTHLRKQRRQIEACKSCTFLHTAPDNLDSLDPEVFVSRY